MMVPLLLFFFSLCTWRVTTLQTSWRTSHSISHDGASNSSLEGKLLVRPAFDESSPRWLDEDGERIEAHGAGMLWSTEDQRWYWYGESKKGDFENPGVNCYSSKSLAGPWKNEGRVLNSSQLNVANWKGPFIVERPKVLYNKKTKKYVMWVHIDHQKDRDFMFATRKPTASLDQCQRYIKTEGCKWTERYSCPLQRPGKLGRAGADGTIGYQCCCDHRLWLKVSAFECAAYRGSSFCDWTSRKSCPGQKLGSQGVATSDESVEYQCCCEHGLWNQSAKAEKVYHPSVGDCVKTVTSRKVSHPIVGTSGSVVNDTGTDVPFRVKFPDGTTGWYKVGDLAPCNEAKRQYTQLSDHGWCLQTPGVSGEHTLFDSEKDIHRPSVQFTLAECQNMCEAAEGCKSIILHKNNTRCAGFSSDCESRDSNKRVVPYGILQSKKAWRCAPDESVRRRRRNQNDCADYCLNIGVADSCQTTCSRYVGCEAHENLPWSGLMAYNNQVLHEVTLKNDSLSASFLQTAPAKKASRAWNAKSMVNLHTMRTKAAASLTEKVFLKSYVTKLKSFVAKAAVKKVAKAKAKTRAKVKRRALTRAEADLAAAMALKQRRRERFIGKFARAADYVMRRVAVATSDTAAGPFTIQHTLMPDGVPSLDLNLWVDNDGAAYFIRSCDNAYTGISRLTDDYLNTTGILSTGPRFEGMALFRHSNGTLYMMTSHLSGWAPNPLMLYRSDGPSLEDPRWTDLGNPTNHETSFNTQPTYIVNYETSNGKKYHIYMADNWLYGGRQGLFDATYVWMPIHFKPDGSVSLKRQLEWDLEHPFKNVV